MLTLNKVELLKGIRLREEELQKIWQKFLASKGAKDKQTERYDAFYTCYGLFGDCIEAPHRIKLNHVETMIISMKKYLQPADLNELRELYNSLVDDLDIIMGEVLGAKRIEGDGN